METKKLNCQNYSLLVVGGEEIDGDQTDNIE
jgi:hypothetical protein